MEVFRNIKVFFKIYWYISYFLNSEGIIFPPFNVWGGEGLFCLGIKYKAVGGRGRGTQGGSYEL